MTTGEERWQPDDGLIYAVQHRPVPIADLSGPDRAWIVAYLAAAGWTVASIAERLRCSLRLVQQIKAEPMTQVAMLAHDQRRDLAAMASLQCMQTTLLLQDLARAQERLGALERQRDVFLDRLTSKESHVSPVLPRLPGSPRTAPPRTAQARTVRLGRAG